MTAPVISTPGAGDPVPSSHTRGAAMTSTARTSAEVLRAARARIKDLDTFSTRKWALDATGEECPASSPNAVAWSAYGALQAEGGFLATPEGRLLLTARDYEVGAEPRVDGRPVAYVHALVLRIYDRAIELAEAQTSDPVLARTEV